MGMTRQDINIQHLTHQVNNLTKLINPSVWDLNFSNSLRPLLGPTSKLVQIELHQHHPPFIPTNVTPPTEVPTDLSGFRNIQGSCDPNARSAIQVQSLQKAKSIQVTTHYLNVNFK